MSPITSELKPSKIIQVATAVAVVATLVLASAGLFKTGIVYGQNQCMLESYNNRIDVDLAKKICYPPENTIKIS